MAPLATATDDYGIYYLGRGGDSHDAYVQHAGRTLSMNVLLRLLQIWRDEVIDRVDEYDLQDEQSWWDKACELFPDETARAVEHMRYWEDEVSMGAKPIYPYA